VNCPKRLEVEGPFLLGLLERHPLRIFDAAMGTGCETVFLAKRGHNVTGNEINRQLTRHAKAFAEREGVSVHFADYDWRAMAGLSKSENFDVVLILGNSLCLLREEQSRCDAVRNFRAICRAGGTLVVDERNFPYILRERRDILKGKFRYSGRVMYCGTSIFGRPDIIEDAHVRFVYEDVKDRHVLGYLDMHPFQNGEVVELFRRVGFESVEIFQRF
jgi:SAM-dependent methyltransferase